MFNFFKTIACSFLFLGTLLTVLSFLFNFSFWYGVRIIQGGIYLFLFGLFMNMLEQYDNRKTEGIKLELKS